VFKEVEEEHRRKEMELELEQKRLEQALNKVDGGSTAVVEEKYEVPTRRVRLDDLDEVLEKSAKKREEMNQELEAARKQSIESEESTQEEVELGETREDFSPSEPVEKPEEDTSTLEETREKAKRIREAVEEDIEKIDE